MGQENIVPRQAILRNITNTSIFGRIFSTTFIEFLRIIE